MRLKGFFCVSIILAFIAIIGLSFHIALFSTSYTATVDRVVDGDTIYLKQSVLGTTKVRLLAIDAPETNYNGSAQEPWGTEAKNYLTQLLPSGTPVTIETDVAEKDNYGRLLAHIQKGSLNINREMVRQGHAVTYYIWPNMKYFESYRRALLKARRDGFGIWNPNNPLKELPFAFRDRVSGSGPDKFTGDYFSKIYVDPEDYKQISIENRVFFFSEEDAQAAGYRRK
ncbi:thermonuclease family protein [Paenactinomyces guangxiensis]|uniref:Thermonuclease family protein n=1 Tax=Paenactinomyces guangxiensis TaxID=1490290 RepID=A0A7W2A8S4_9BACL|nr:thermonuclease family protein [Paenactinomyces guangxiensis]MBA4494477.1 thermonuclease family protein [Paenactinomyces guangxiensis]MBH8591468.1 thermonuclease family protein [Paenactinomyces guangxiensis]